MTTTEPPMPAASERVPAAAWAVAWSFLGGQLLQLAEAGTQDASAWPLSILFGVLVVAFFSHGVLRARMVRFVIVVVVLSFAVLAELVTLALGGDLPAAVGLVVSGAQLGCLVWFARTPWFAWQRGRPGGGPSLAPLMAIAVLVGILGGVIGAETAQTGV